MALKAVDTFRSRTIDAPNFRDWLGMARWIVDTKPRLVTRDAPENVTFFFTSPQINEWARNMILSVLGDENTSTNTGIKHLLRKLDGWLVHSIRAMSGNDYIQFMSTCVVDGKDCPGANSYRRARTGETLRDNYNTTLPD